MSKGISLFITVVASTFLLLLSQDIQDNILRIGRKESRDEPNINRNRLGSFYGAIISII